MRFRPYCTFILVFLLSFRVFADDIDGDTVLLQEVTIRGSYYDRFGAGSRLVRIDSATLSENQDVNLNDLIRLKVPVSFKSYGNGMLSTISFRGTGPGHTAVLWNGVNVNQPTVGQSDFSIFPVFAVDAVKIHSGAASSRYGSEAIGGGILLESVPDWNNGRSVSAAIHAGSFHNLFYSARTNLQWGKHILTQTKFYRHTSRNDFPYHNFTRPGNPEIRQTNAAISQYGLVQDIYYQPTSWSRLSFNGWFNFLDREIQPPMTDLDAKDTQVDRNLRMMLDYEIQSPLGILQLKTGILRDFQRYNNQVPIVTLQQWGQTALENQFGPWDLRLGGKYNHVVAQVSYYEAERTENKVDLFGGVVFHGLAKLAVSLNIRELFTTGYQAPLSPSIGFKYDLISNPAIRFFVSGQGSMNYRIPTLNDRYWHPGGNEDLRPERSRNLESSASLELSGDLGAGITLSGYSYWVKDWILWIPGPAYWTPANVRRVHAEGLELTGFLDKTVGRSIFRLAGNFSVSKSIIAGTNPGGTDNGGNQLPYTPRCTGYTSFTYHYKPWFAGLNMSFTGTRFPTTDNESLLPSYVLIGVRAGREVYVGEMRFHIDARIENLLDTEYQNLLYRAMPGRNYRIGINFFFH